MIVCIMHNLGGIAYSYTASVVPIGTLYALLGFLVVRIILGSAVATTASAIRVLTDFTTNLLLRTSS